MHFWQSISRRIYGALAVGLVVASCAPTPGTEEPSERFPVKAEAATFSVALGLRDVGGTVYMRNETVFRKFVKEYLRRGRSALVVATTAPVNAAADQAVVARLRSEGVRKSAIVLLPGKAPSTDGQGAVFSFRGFMVSVPECGNWKGETGFNPTNLPHTNYGCSYHRNIGLMLADPGDLIAPDGVVEADARRMDNVIRIFREGKGAGADTPKSEKGKFATPSQEQ